MRIALLLAILLVMGITSCRVNNDPIPQNNSQEKQANEQAQVHQAETTTHKQIEEKYIHTKYEYDSGPEGQIVIQNSYPKGGFNYFDSNGQKFTYAVFWTEVSNESQAPLKLKIEFPADSFQLPSDSSIQFNLLLPSETMTAEKIPLIDYGLENLNSVLDSGIGESSASVTILEPKSSHMFYTLALSNKGVNGVVRAGFRLDQQKVLFQINGIEFECGAFEIAD